MKIFNNLFTFLFVSLFFSQAACYAMNDTLDEESLIKSFSVTSSSKPLKFDSLPYIIKSISSEGFLDGRNKNGHHVIV